MLVKDTSEPYSRLHSNMPTFLTPGLQPDVDASPSRVTRSQTGKGKTNKRKAEEENLEEREMSEVKRSKHGEFSRCCSF